MSELFEDEDTLLMDDNNVAEAEKIGLQTPNTLNMDARRRLECMLEEKRLREELEDYRT